MILRNVSLVMVLLAVGLTACSQREQQGAVPRMEEKTFTLAPATVSVKASFLTGELQDIKVTETVEQGTGKVVSAPKLRATLKLKNTSENQAARLIAGKVEYVDTGGNLIPLAEGREETSFKFYSYQMERLDPGMATTQSVEVPFPAAALKDKKLKTLRLKLSYIPTPYREETISLDVAVAQ